MSEPEETKPTAEEQEVIPLAKFLEAVPPGKVVGVSSVSYTLQNTVGYRLNTPDIELYCHDEKCNGMRYFLRDGAGTIYVSSEAKDIFLYYRCRNCLTTTKTFALSVVARTGSSEGVAFKYGEEPSFGPHIPARVLKLIGTDQELFLKGRRSENQGLGVGAFAYYRRVVENQKGRILDEIIRVAERVKASPDIIADLKTAKSETQFSKAIESIKHGIPESLLVSGHNPLTLLHSALSEGVHDLTDERCLELATSIRMVLTDLAERSSQVLKDEKALSEAVSRLLTRKEK